jgi:hypothetical protein
MTSKLSSTLSNLINNEDVDLMNRQLRYYAEKAILDYELNWFKSESEGEDSVTIKNTCFAITLIRNKIEN